MQITETEKLQWIIGAGIFLGIIHNFLFWDENAGLNFPVFVFFILGALWFLNRKYGGKIDRTTAILSVLVVFFSGMVFIRSSELLTFFNVVGTGLLLLTLISLHIGKKLTEYFPVDYFKMCIRPVYFIPTFLKKMSDFFIARVFEKYNPKTKEIIRGTVLAIVALVIFTALFASADIIFGNIVRNIFAFKIDDEIIGRLAMLGFFTALFLGALTYTFTRISPDTEVVATQKDRTFGVIETKIFLSSIAVLFLIFIIFQLTYLFGGESNLVSQGITYAEYARKGFFELLTVAFLTFFVISFAEKQVVKKEDGHLMFFKILSSILVAEVVAILISAFVRLSLYEHAYGFTDFRLYSHALMIWVGIVLILLSHYILTNGNRAKFTLRLFCSVVLLLFTMNLLNPDALIAKLNMERYRETGKVDGAYLGTLSYDALPYTVSLLNNPDETVRTKFAHNLYWFVTRYNESIGGVRDWDIDSNSWKSNRLMRAKASELMAPYRKIIEESKATPIESTDLVQ